MVKQPCWREEWEVRKESCRVEAVAFGCDEDGVAVGRSRSLRPQLVQGSGYLRFSLELQSAVDRNDVRLKGIYKIRSFSQQCQWFKNNFLSQVLPEYFRHFDLDIQPSILVCLPTY